MYLSCVCKATPMILQQEKSSYTWGGGSARTVRVVNRSFTSFPGGFVELYTVGPEPAVCVRTAPRPLAPGEYALRAYTEFFAEAGTEPHSHGGDFVPP